MGNRNCSCLSVDGWWNDSPSITKDNTGSGWRFGVGAMQYRAHPHAFDKTWLQWPRRDYTNTHPRRGVLVFWYFCVFVFFFVFEGSVCMTFHNTQTPLFRCVFVSSRLGHRTLPWMPEYRLVIKHLPESINRSATQQGIYFINIWAPL